MWKSSNKFNYLGDNWQGVILNDKFLHTSVRLLCNILTSHIRYVRGINDYKGVD